MNNYNNFIKEIEYSKTQLQNLRTDLENSKLTKEKFMEYYQTEQAEVMRLSVKVNETVDGMEETVKKLKTGREDIKPLLDSLRVLQWRNLNA